MYLRIFLFSQCLVCLCCGSLQQVDSTPRPNIIWLVSEDNSKHFHQLYDSTGVHMSSLSRLAKQGIIFNHAFSNAPVCSVARSTIISGCYAPRIGAQYHRCIQKVPMPPELRMFPYYLQRAGYYTTNNAKEDYNLIKGDSVWHESSRQASYRDRPQGTPFFHVQNFGVTHEGQLHFDKNDVEIKPTETDPNLVKPFPYHPKSTLSKYTYARLYDLHRKLDHQLNAFLDQIEADGLLDDTFIFYYGDHGGVLPRSKGYVYESGLHVPMLVYVPKNFEHLVSAEVGNRVDAMVSFVDLGPTVLNLAGIDVPLAMDGKAFLGKGVGQLDLEQRNVAFGYADRFDEKYDLVRSLRKRNLKYIRSYQPFNVDALHNFYRYRMQMFSEWRDLYHEGGLSEIQAQFFNKRKPEALYDLDTDPHEVHNLSGDPSYQGALMEMRAALQEKVKSLPDLSFYPEPHFLKEAVENPVAFGQSHKEEIIELIDVADLALQNFAEVSSTLKAHLNSEHPWIRYWALITCSTFGSDARVFFEKALEMAQSDDEYLVRLRALEFLALNEVPFSKHLFNEVLDGSASMAEANLMLNTMALLKEVVPHLIISNLEQSIPQQWVDAEKSLVPHRLAYLINE